jgi:hypothetical protein
VISILNISNTNIWFLPLFLVIIVLAAFTRANYDYTQLEAGGTDFLIYRTASRELILDGNSPYAELVALKNQVAFYGRPARPPENELRVVYPIYTTIFFAPFSLVADFNLARTLWMTALQAALLVLTFFCLRVTGWQPGLLLLTMLLFFSLLWYHAISAVTSGNVVVLVALIIAAVFFALKSGKDELAGILLALTTIKPQVVLLLVLFIFIWSILNRRWPIIFWFVVGIVFLSLGGMVFIPDWPIQFLNSALRYLEYASLDTPGEVFTQWWPGIGARLGVGLSILLSIVLLVEWHLARGKGFRWFLWTACLTLVVSQWIGIPTNPDNFIVLFMPLILILATWDERWKQKARLQICLLLLAAFLGLWGLFFYTSGPSFFIDHHPIMVFALPAMLLVGLYWVRWWAIRPPRFSLESIPVE